MENGDCQDDNDADGSMKRSYLAVLVIEALVLLALWAASRYFSSL